MDKFPKNLKEALIASVPNAAVMVVAMVTLNLWIYGALTLPHFMVVVPLMFIVAFTFDFVVVGPLVMRLVRRYNKMRLMPFIRVAIMAGVLTFVAPMLESGTVITGHQYLMAAPRNYVVALMVQIFIALPVGLYVLGRVRNIMVK
ncbi:MAG: hypothetical protein K2L95_01010 [Alphaproteobacteria bacterium]|nr:hypothetical protein [Alphaproteobacteria bacterium]MDE6570785.1 hypothetical protein [Alphaproteobacteria bacterium]